MLAMKKALLLGVFFFLQAKELRKGSNNVNIIGLAIACTTDQLVMYPKTHHIGTRKKYVEWFFFGLVKWTLEALLLPKLVLLANHKEVIALSFYPIIQKKIYTQTKYKKVWPDLYANHRVIVLI